MEIGGRGKGQSIRFESAKNARSRLPHGPGLASNLPLDELPRPARRLDRARLELAVRLGLLDHNRQPLLAEGVDQLAVGVCVREVTSNISNKTCFGYPGVDLPDNAHGRPHEGLAPVQIVGDDVKKVEDRLDVLLESASYSS